MCPRSCGGCDKHDDSRPSDRKIAQQRAREFHDLHCDSDTICDLPGMPPLLSNTKPNNCVERRALRSTQGSTWITPRERAFMHMADGIILLAGGMATLVILNFGIDQLGPRQMSSTADATARCCPTAHRRIIQQWLPTNIRCPDLASFLVAVLTYTAVGIFHLAEPPPRWADCGLIAIMTTLVAGICLPVGFSAIISGVIVSGFFSLVCSKRIEWFASATPGRERGPTSTTVDKASHETR